ncbi:flowering time control protein FPA-like, partial [Triticum dicoccoides]|uniref:flowering time control protein FPA-like n=1 Tax=Triticum dicoccoides TaxID=85692 RepID=UPI001890FE84
LQLGRGRGRGRGGGGGGGRGRFSGGRGDGSPRLGGRDDPPPTPRRSSGWGVAPPSRHLWVGSLAPGVTASDLSQLLHRCGDIEGITRDPGRTFAFVSFMREQDAVAAVRELQGARLQGTPVRIEFSKGDKSSGSYVDDRHAQSSDERHFVEHGRKHQSSPEKSVDKSKRNKSTEPSEVLWIGFPAGLKVDEAALWEAFSPFGEIVKITTFPGRTYGFVKYTTITAACRAKEALQGRLFNNPRVSICFSRNEGVAAEVGRCSSVAPYSPHLNRSVRSRSVFEDQDFEAFTRPRRFDSPPRDLRMSSLRAGPERLLRDADDVGFSRDNYLRRGPQIESGHVSNFEPFRMRGLGPERRMSEDIYEQHRSSPTVRGETPWQSIPFERPRRAFPLEDSWDADDHSYPLSKKLRTGELHDAELPEYPFSEFDRGHVDSGYPRRPFRDLREDDAHPITYEPPMAHGRNYIEPLRNPNPPVDNHEAWRSQNSFAMHAREVDRSTPEHHGPLPKEEWSWNGTIAKGGTPICRARCFPVGKVLNFMLPDFLDCTARTNLEMLSKHYYEAASSWVVFFVPENDADMAAYNDFMNYLGDKQRAAVCKLGERSTLFLVPPSDFSEHVLRVPGKVSISGVILKFQQANPDLTSANRQPEALEKMPTSFASYLNTDVSSHEDRDALRRLDPPDTRTVPQGPDYLQPSTGVYTPASTDFIPPYKFANASPYLTSQLPQQMPAPDSRRETAQGQHQQSPNVWPSGWSNNNDPSPGSGNFNSLAASAVSHTQNDRTSEPYSFATQGIPKGTPSVYAPGEASNMSLPSMKPPQPPSRQVVRPQQTPSAPVSLPPVQLAQLATLLAQQNQRGVEAGLPVGSSNRQSGFIQNYNPREHASVMPDSSGRFIQNANHASVMPDSSGSIPVHNSQLPVPPSVPSQLQVHPPPIQGHSSVPLGSFVPPLPAGPPPFQQLTSGGASMQTLLPSAQQMGQQLSAQEDLDGDPQKRLQATLQLAATLLQQIHKQSKPGGQQ